MNSHKDVLSHASGPPRAAPGKRVLLAWEFGAGRTHIANLLGVALRLRGAGVECLASLYEPHFAGEFAALNIPVVQNFVWPARRRAPLTWQERPITGLGDVLTNLGFCDFRTLGAAIAHYRGLFEIFEPDAVLCETAFGGILAARGRMPVFAFGSDLCLPPIKDDAFALYDRVSGPPSFDQRTVMTAINAGLEQCGALPLAELADLLRIDGVFPYGPAAFDVYAASRSGELLPAHLPGVRRPIEAGEGGEIFVYLHGFVQTSPEAMEALAALPGPARLYMPGLTDANRARFPADRFTIEDHAVPADLILTQSRCVVHHGGSQLTTACLAAGIPQVILAKEQNNEIGGRFVTERGLGMAIAIGAASGRWLIEAVNRARDDAAMHARCRAARPEFLAWIERDPSDIVVDAVLGRLAAI
ncbi:glycosyltransferase [Jiella sp. M17.18]|uniref:glycosyltransferase n=1 Tax=Jiella sp. M17.18 TaxID=3234247 RepID=UPI0034DED4BF